ALLAHQLLLLVARVVAPLESFEFGQGRGRRLVEQQRHGLGLLGLGHEHRMAAKHDGFVFQLVPVDPGEDLGQARVRHAVGDAVQQVQVARPLERLVVGVSYPPPGRCSRRRATGWWSRCPGTAQCTWGPR
uniref:Uncharacterized protein n=1 Tax=Vombatus ursinus TaxID=29139 RepID=A0A4X2KS73_VOMUR